jgi:hypothetical protein
LFPVGHEVRALGLDGQLHSIYTAALRNREHPPSHGYTLGVSHIFSDGVSESISRSTTVNCGLEASLPAWISLAFCVDNL